MRLVGIATIAAAAAACCAIPALAQKAESLPLREVVLFSSGVGYFERSGQINGSSETLLTFRVEHVNDVLKSLVLLDPSGKAEAVTYGGAEPISRRVRIAGLAGNSRLSIADLLRQFQGARVHIRSDARGDVEGRLISVSSRLFPSLRPDAPPVTIAVFNVMEDQADGEDGRLISIAETEVDYVKLMDERLDRELQESLEMLAGGLDDRTRTLNLKFGDGGAREVAAGYLRETPVWKTSYRLVLEKGQKPYLQGWSVVENVTEDDWKDVRLSLVSGRPISFIQDLFQPLYVNRPVVAPQVIGSPVPQLYRDAVESASGVAPGFRAADARGGMREAAGGFGGGRPGPPGPAGPSGAPAPSRMSVMSRQGVAAAPRSDGSVNIETMAQQASAAAGEDAGELFSYSIKDPVTIARGQSAMAPIIGTVVDGEAVSIYDPQVDRDRALSGFLLRNNTGLHLAGGPVTVFRDGTYAGDAQISQTQPGDDRLLSYAVDLEVVAETKPGPGRIELAAMTINSGVLFLTRKSREETVYGFRNKSDQPRTMLVQHPVRPGYTLVEPAKADERTSTHYRFKLAVPAGERAELKVVTDRPLIERIVLIDHDLKALDLYTRNAEFSPAVKQALIELVGRRRAITDVRARIAALQAEVEASAKIRRGSARI